MDKRTLYVGGLHENVDRSVLYNVFGTFGELVNITFPNEDAGKHRGYAFVEFESADDAAEAIFNMNESVLFGQVIHVNISRPVGELSTPAMSYMRPTFEDTDDIKPELISSEDTDI
ncbi:peptidyl-prolyl cis-trans isomerase E [Monocercomonoides exilis]|uniref:peptidyl-prolyl cis-trans isomerase E n=1 Tax=Monocercomonoides exilis TaxID=2049356 RepID=UPI003559EE51|nr:peptidyl-prolyl cis-trans isomerase E [Monocercomonoides exilis]|eukprot:MONOS_10560.1-p1 / transcript=MONOS_10560.1 / gene=MONOS_10560 / organism=Monocercomonoides_exilis_PA203 / gene_product=peptidyl-prolyl cis-trans isomerase E / transcript_product=peptidyl-prolyl cis-trans isomerase E / location=Mono_scaffold00485:13326-13886(+) / protein_length=116 / sequence_SO=supercontig / SO=protein_coding / is_pseudo=false